MGSFHPSPMRASTGMSTAQSTFADSAGATTVYLDPWHRAYSEAINKAGAKIGSSTHRNFFKDFSHQTVALKHSPSFGYKSRQHDHAYAQSVLERRAPRNMPPPSEHRHCFRDWPEIQRAKVKSQSKSM